MVTLARILSATLQRDCVCCSIGVMMSSHGVGLMFVSFKLRLSILAFRGVLERYGKRE